ncbi:hypothetical protein KDAU_33340 [Dictyobacter aurantiacus]|uniref:Uncharacterized protein n=2 Tax=Dictyobacter aurantiacus TaxID=1936993 RepID=A0A401ZGJ6_9CHLR|nr:hypothetical protein KDAU_33340 [Dictyobacter aurantiacus]
MRYRTGMLALLCIALVVTASAFTFFMIFPAHASNSDTIGNAVNTQQLNNTVMSEVKITHNRKTTAPFHISTQNATVTPTATAITLPYNNIGTVMDQGTTSATANTNFDGAHNGYSQNALIKSGLFSGTSWFGNSNYYQEVMVNGTPFDWPNVAYGAPDNIASAGQVIALPATANAPSLGFLGAATGGIASGTATITYTDGSTQTFTLSFDDWTLGGGNAKLSSFDRIATAMTYRDRQGGVIQSVKTYIFYTSVNLQTSKTVQSITLPNKSSLHIFSIGFGQSSYYNPYSNTGISDDANTHAANLDGSGNSYSMQELSHYILPGDTINYQGTQLYWPNVLGGSPDNITADGQKVTFDASYASGKTKIGFVGTASGGPGCGTVNVLLGDNTTYGYGLCWSDWTLGGGKQYPLNTDTYFLGFPDRNTASGSKQVVKTYLFYSEIILPKNETVSAITLPTSTHAPNATTPGGQWHIFALGLGSGDYTMNVGSTADSSTHIFGNFDGAYNSYSTNAMQKAGVVPVSLPTSQTGVNNLLNKLTFNGVTFYWDQNASVLPDNMSLVPDGSQQKISLNNPIPDEDSGTIPVNPVSNATKLAFLGSSTNGSSSNSFIILFSDGSSQDVTVSFSDWCASSPSFNNQIALSMPYRNTPTGSQTRTNHLYYAEVTLQAPLHPGAVPVSLVRTANPGSGIMHIFSIGLK